MKNMEKEELNSNKKTPVLKTKDVIDFMIGLLLYWIVALPSLLSDYNYYIGYLIVPFIPIGLVIFIYFVKNKRRYFVIGFFINIIILFILGFILMSPFLK